MKELKIVVANLVVSFWRLRPLSFSLLLAPHLDQLSQRGITVLLSSE